MECFATSLEMVMELRPQEPVYCLHPSVLRDSVRQFAQAFPGSVMYAVKCNDHPDILSGIHAAGIRQFDVASVSEMQAAAKLGNSVLHYMHPVKNREAVEHAYNRYDVRTFAVDHEAELEKILAMTGERGDLTLILRIAVPRSDSLCSLDDKFGAGARIAPVLLRRIFESGNRAGLTFHVGSQCLDPSAYEDALAICGDIILEAGVPTSIVDVGGGFPAAYVGCEPPPLESYMASIQAGIAKLPVTSACRICCEPGRVLVAEACTLVVKVEARHGRRLYLNDGAYGSLADAKMLGIMHPVRLLRAGAVSQKLARFVLCGPTCDSFDILPGFRALPEDLHEGDWIEFGQMGAYSNVLQTRFNGFEARRFVAVADGALRPIGYENRKMNGWDRHRLHAL